MEKIKLEQYRGDTFQFAVLVKDSAGEPISLADATVRFTLAAEPDITEDTEGVEITIDEGAGRIDVAVFYELMEIDPGAYPFDVVVTFDDDTRRTLVLGELTVRDDVTKETE